MVVVVVVVAVVVAVVVVVVVELLTTLPEVFGVGNLYNKQLLTILSNALQ